MFQFIRNSEYRRVEDGNYFLEHAVGGLKVDESATCSIDETFGIGGIITLNIISKTSSEVVYENSTVHYAVSQPPLDDNKGILKGPHVSGDNNQEVEEESYEYEYDYGNEDESWEVDDEDDN